MRTKNKKINMGIIGCGHWGPNFVRNFSKIKMAHVKYVCDLSSERLAHIKKLYPDVITTRSYMRILKDKDVNAVIITTPAITHYKFAKECLLSGKHILIEKPITTNIAEAEELIELSRKKKRILMVGHTFMYNPAINKIKEYIKEGYLGRIYYMYSRRTNLGPLRHDVSATWDLAPHDISILTYLLGMNPIEIIAKAESYLQKNKEDVAFVTLTYPKKIIANIHVSWLDPRKVREITIVGTEKMLVFDDLNLTEPIKIYDKKVVKKRFKQDYDTFQEFRMIIQEGKVITPKINMEEPLRLECRHFLECIEENKAPLSDGLNGLNVLRVLVAIQDSLKDKIPVRIRENIKCQ